MNSEKSRITKTCSSLHFYLRFPLTYQRNNGCMSCTLCCSFVSQLPKRGIFILIWQYKCLQLQYSVWMEICETAASAKRRHIGVIKYRCADNKLQRPRTETLMFWYLSCQNPCRTDWRCPFVYCSLRQKWPASTGAWAQAAPLACSLTRERFISVYVFVKQGRMLFFKCVCDAATSQIVRTFPSEQTRYPAPFSRQQNVSNVRRSLM